MGIPDKYYYEMVKKKNKYGNSKIEYDGHTFDSLREKRRYAELKLLERAGKIKNLELQKKFELIPAQYEGENAGSEGLIYVYKTATDSYALADIGTCTDTEVVVADKYNFTFPEDKNIELAKAIHEKIKDKSKYSSIDLAKKVIVMIRFS